MRFAGRLLRAYALEQHLGERLFALSCEVGGATGARLTMAAGFTRTRVRHLHVHLAHRGVLLRPVPEPLAEFGALALEVAWALMQLDAALGEYGRVMEEGRRAGRSLTGEVLVAEWCAMEAVRTERQLRGLLEECPKEVAR